MKLLALSASLRKDSFNTKLIRLACEAAKKSGAEVELISLGDYPLPPYNGDIEAASGVPNEGKLLAEKITGSSGIMISSPEYNYAPPGHFKNTFDWISRIRPQPWNGVPVFLLTASPGYVGGNRGLISLRIPFDACGSYIFPSTFPLPNAGDAFDNEGKLKDVKIAQRLEATVKDFLAFVSKLRN